MARTINRQLGNVGNLGDIIKHAALVELASLFAKGLPSQPRQLVSFVDTHTFQLHAPLPDRKAWERNMEKLEARHPAYGRYAAMERASLAQTRRYLCSSGLVLDTLGDQRACAVLAESNAASRAEIAAQLSEEGPDGAIMTRPNVAVVEDASRIDRDGSVPAGGALLVHVDPFALTQESWSTFAPALDAMAARSAYTAMVVYRYSRGARTAWPESQVPMVAETRGGPHEVATYASPGIADAVREVCASLGWTATPTG